MPDYKCVSTPGLFCADLYYTVQIDKWGDTMWRKTVAVFLAVCVFFAGMSVLNRTYVCYGQTAEEAQSGSGEAVSVEAPSVVLMEQSTGTVIYEKASHEQLRPASITKIMTLILIFDALKEKKIKLEDTVTTSEHAASMGGSQVFLEPNEQQSVETLIKCISVASANDAWVAYR